MVQKLGNQHVNEVLLTGPNRITPPLYPKYSRRALESINLDSTTGPQNNRKLNAGSPVLPSIPLQSPKQSK